jgi:hypothetical protein
MMPVRAQPIPPDPINTSLIPLRREYHDLLQRPMSGTVTITGSQASRAGTRNVLPEPVRVPLVNGVLDVLLPADTYTLVADLWSVDDVQSRDEDTVTLKRRG